MSSDYRSTADADRHDAFVRELAENTLILIEEDRPDLLRFYLGTPNFWAAVILAGLLCLASGSLVFTILAGGGMWPVWLEGIQKQPESVIPLLCLFLSIPMLPALLAFCMIGIRRTYVLTPENLEVWYGMLLFEWCRKRIDVNKIDAVTSWLQIYSTQPNLSPSSKLLPVHPPDTGCIIRYGWRYLTVTMRQQEGAILRTLLRNKLVSWRSEKNRE